MVVVVLAEALVLVVLMVLTAVGSRRRGKSVAGAATSGLFFPITWAVWYLRDDPRWLDRRTRARG